MKQLAFCLALLSAVACSSSQETTQRTYNPDQGYSVGEPVGWTRRNDDGATLYQGNGEQAKHTIVIRSIAKPSMLADRLPATPENVERQTRVAIMALPGAHLEGIHRLEDASGPGEEFEFTFRAPSARNAVYRRRHVVIVGRSKIFHVFYTAPIGETVDGQRFDAVVSTLREEA